MTCNLNFDSFDNCDPRILTTLVIGTEAAVRNHILTQHRLGAAEAASWSRLLPVPNCPNKVMIVLNRNVPAESEG